MRQLAKEETRRLVVAAASLAAMGLVIAVLAISGHLQPLMSATWQFFQNGKQMRGYVESWGAWAPLIFIALQVFQVVAAPIPGELTGAVGGFIFGVIPSVVYSSIGLSIGSVIAFAAARIIGQPFVNLVVSEELQKRFNFLTEPRGTLLTLALFIIPGFPKDILCYLLGLSSMRFLTFAIVCSLGRIPGTVLLSLLGDGVCEGNWCMLIVLTATCIVALGIGFFNRERIELWLKGPRTEAS